MKPPILKIAQFQKTEPLNDFYINSFSDHIITSEALVSNPHKHNFYLCVMFTKGTGTHEIDFNSYKISPGKVFLLRPGQTHSWKFDSTPEGFIFFHSQAFYDLRFLDHKLDVFPFYNSFQNPPVLELSPKKINSLNAKFQEIHTEYLQNDPFRELKIVSLINTIYIDFLREYPYNMALEKRFSPSYLTIVENLETLINENFHKERFPKFYANRLNITTKHLNRAIRETLNKTTSELISERIILEAKRLIVHSDENLTSIANTLEFSDYSYFSKIFKSKTGSNPMDFRKKYVRK